MRYCRQPVHLRHIPAGWRRCSLARASSNFDLHGAGARTPNTLMRAPDGEPQIPECYLREPASRVVSLASQENSIYQFITALERGRPKKVTVTAQRPTGGRVGSHRLCSAEPTGCNPEKEPLPRFPPRAGPAIGTCARKVKRGTPDPCAPQPPPSTGHAQPPPFPGSPSSLWGRNQWAAGGVKGEASYPIRLFVPLRLVEI